MTSSFGSRHSVESLAKLLDSCPTCTGPIYRSERRGWRDFFLFLLRRYPWRCRACNHRFYAASRR